LPAARSVHACRGATRPFAAAQHFALPEAITPKRLSGDRA
jgi:hypothetical protein